MARIVSERMAQQGGGHIVNLGSIAGTEAYEAGNVYCATKHAVHALSRGMRIDLLGTGVKVTEIRPGKVETEFSLIRFHGDKEKADKVYEGIRPLRGEDIARTILWAVTQPPRQYRRNRGDTRIAGQLLLQQERDVSLRRKKRHGKRFIGEATQ